MIDWQAQYILMSETALRELAEKDDEIAQLKIENANLANIIVPDTWLAEANKKLKSLTITKKQAI